MRDKKEGRGTVVKVREMVTITLILVAFVSTMPLALAAEITINPPDPTVGDTITINGTGFNGTVTIKTTVTCWKPVSDGKCQCTMEDFEIPQGARFTLSVREVKDNVTIYIKKSILPWWTVTPGFPGFTFDYSPNTSTVSSIEVPVGGKYKIDVIGDAVDGSEICTMITTATMEVTAYGDGNFSEPFNTQGIPICNFTINATDEYGTSAENTTNLYLFGDASKDGQVNGYDCVCIARRWAGISGYDNSTVSWSAAAGLAPDCNLVTLADARCLAESLIGMHGIPCGCP